MANFGEMATVGAAVKEDCDFGKAGRKGGEKGGEKTWTLDESNISYEVFSPNEVVVFIKSTHNMFRWPY